MGHPSIGVHSTRGALGVGQNVETVFLRFLVGFEQIENVV
jgi:hypothetical protein